MKDMSTSEQQCYRVTHLRDDMVVTRMMHGGHFLVSLVEFNTSDKILLMRSLLKENIIFWEEDVFDEKPAVNEELESEIASLSDDIANSSLTDEPL